MTEFFAHSIVETTPTVLPTVDAFVAVTRPDLPVHAIRPATIAADAGEFVRAFPGDVLYAVKCNPEPAVLRAVWAGGVRHFDCASLPEIERVRALFPDAAIHFLHPVKCRAAIRAAYRLHDVRDFAIDSEAELDKVLEETGDPGDLGLIVRLAVPGECARYDLSGKFGATVDEAARLLRRARAHAVQTGLSFHVGSQCRDPLAWRQAIAAAAETVAMAGFAPDILDVGGGFPAAYADETPPPLGAFFAEIEASAEQFGLGGLRLWAEPGRALVASGVSVVVQVQGRRGDALFLNDGIYGSLSDAGAPGFVYPCRLLRDSAAAPEGFRFFGPSCDAADRMAGPFVLPGDVGEGDWIEIGQLGAYSSALRTDFNGFEAAYFTEVRG